MTSKNFTHNWATIPKLKQINTPEGRRYLIEGTETKYPSITTVLGDTSDKSSFFEWRKRVGEEKANAISRAATTRGTSMHKLCERYLLNEQVDAPMPTAAEDLAFEGITKGDWTAGQLMFSGIRESLHQIDNVRLLETAMYSHRLKVAGTVDCVAEYNGVLSVIDFKTSRRFKSKDSIDDYFMQGAFYLQAFHEITGELPKQIVIMISIQDGTCVNHVISGKEIIHFAKKLDERIKAYIYNRSNK